MTTAASGSYGLGTGVDTTCAGTAYVHNGGGSAWSSSVVVCADGKRVAVLLLNGRTADNSGDNTYPPRWNSCTARRRSTAATRLRSATWLRIFRQAATAACGRTCRRNAR